MAKHVIGLPPELVVKRRRDIGGVSKACCVVYHSLITLYYLSGAELLWLSVSSSLHHRHQPLSNAS